MIKYRTRRYSNEIEAVEVERETKHFVVLSNDRKDAKSSDYYNYHNTYEEAKEYLLNRERYKIERLELDIKVAKRNIVEIELEISK